VCFFFWGGGVPWLLTAADPRTEDSVEPSDSRSSDGVEALEAHLALDCLLGAVNAPSTELLRDLVHTCARASTAWWCRRSKVRPTCSYRRCSPTSSAAGHP